ncbi:hypothetical protein [Cellulomonas palmilytica]|uniref:hypothetical protein n=1 Tax=Cellulomonas palmilytica TaxID=2608402 RepID=UPI001F1EDD9F|nr:hypothetical protein [Cellulomonas palmilytica]UJP40872.1 hypothetical protein F1D97_05175 [Cellulomonas palmilytica]
MTEASAIPAAGAAALAAAGMRELADDERGHLDRLRGHLAASGVPVSTVEGLGDLLQAAHAAWVTTPAGQRPDPSPMITSIAVGVGDLILASAPAARWVLHVDGPTASPALLSTDGSAAVVPFADVRRRWADGAARADERAAGQVPAHVPGDPTQPDPSDVDGDAAWLERYVTAASSHLAAAEAALVQAAFAEAGITTPGSGLHEHVQDHVPAPRPPVPDEHAWQPEQGTEQATQHAAGSAAGITTGITTGSSTGSSTGQVASVGVAPEDVLAARAEVVDEVEPPQDATPRGRRATRARGAADLPDEPVIRYRTPGELPYVPSVDAQNLALRALDRGLTHAISDGPTPFAMRDDGTNVHVKWFQADNDAALGLAEKWVTDALGLRAAIGWIVPLDDDAAAHLPGLGAVPPDDTAASLGADHAVVVLASDARMPGMVVAHRFSSGARTGAAGCPIGEPIVVGPCPTVL